MPNEHEILDGTKTSAEWGQAAPSVCVLPVGTFEQHSIHLPLICDDFQAEYFAMVVARELGAALFPTVNYGTSLEQTGFPGTLTLRPETLMQVIRDIAAAAEEQGFTTMIIVNAHGGNYCLGPVVRDINRRDGRLKIILVDFWTFIDEDILDSPMLRKTDIHSGEFETSLMLALAPEWVKPGAVDMESPVENWRQSDLNTFGMGFFAEHGAAGCPSLASREKGERIVASIKKNMLRHIKERLEWLERNRTYSGKGLRKQ